MCVVCLFCELGYRSGKKQRKRNSETDTENGHGNGYGAKEMNYMKHLKANWKVALHSFNDFLEHFIHGLLPFIKWEHEQPKRKLSVVLTITKIKKHKPNIDIEEAIDELRQSDRTR